MSQVVDILKNFSLEELVGISVIYNEPSDSPILLEIDHRRLRESTTVRDTNYWKSIFGDCKIWEAKEKVAKLREVEDLWNLWDHELDDDTYGMGI